MGEMVASDVPFSTEPLETRKSSGTDEEPDAVFCGIILVGVMLVAEVTEPLEDVELLLLAPTVEGLEDDQLDRVDTECRCSPVSPESLEGIELIVEDVLLLIGVDEGLAVLDSSTEEGCMRLIVRLTSAAYTGTLELENAVGVVAVKVGATLEASVVIMLY